METQRHSHLEPEDINVMEYVTTLYKKRMTIILIVIATVIASLGFSAFAPNRGYESSIILSLGSARGQFFETPQETMDSVATSDALRVETGDSPDSVSIIATAASSTQAERLVEDAAQTILARHAQIYQSHIQILETRINEAQESLKENDLYSTRFQALVNRSPNDVSIIQGYLGIRSRIQELKSQLLEYQLEKDLSFKQTKIKKPLQTEPLGNHISFSVALSMGILTGLVISIFFVFIREWWKKSL